MIELGKQGGGAQAGAQGVAVDTSDQSFMQDVVDASMRAPVVVLLWSRVDPPSQSLAREIEREVAATKGAVKLVRLDVDRNPAVAGQLGVQSFPAVIAAFQGQLIQGFQGMPGPQQLREFVTRLAQAGGQAGEGAEEGMSLDDAIAAAEGMLEEGAASDAMQTFAAILAEDPENPRAIAGLARALLALDKVQEARATLDNAPAALAEDPAIKAARAAVDLAENAGSAGEEADLAQRLERDPNDHQARFDLAGSLIARRQNEAAVEQLLELFRRDREWNDGAAKERLLTLIDSLGPKDPLAAKARRRLSSLVFA
ncbi:MAG: tetratricopeptide repeat protein [Paracoccaceae bacterium]